MKKALIFILWLIVLGVSLKQHTPWRDEYQSWLVSTRTPDLSSFIEGIRYERHPPLHYLLQRSLVSLVPQSLSWDSQVAVQTITLPFAIGTAGLLLFGLGLPLHQAAFLLFSPYLFREYAVISRTYIIGLFFLLLAVALVRKGRVSLGFLAFALSALTHLLFTWVCGAILAILLLRNRSWRKRRVLWATVPIFTLALISQIPPSDTLFPSALNLSAAGLLRTIKLANQSLWGIEKIWKTYSWNTMPMSTDLAMILIIPALLLIRKYLDLRVLALVCLPPLFLLATTYSGATRHLGVPFFGFVACYLLFARPPSTGRSFRLNPLTLFSFTLFVSFLGWWLSWAPFRAIPHFSHSGAREMRASTKGMLEEGLLLAENETIFFTWAAESKSRFFHVLRDRWLDYPYFRKSEYIYSDFEEWCHEKMESFRTQNPGKTIYLGLALGAEPPKSCGPLTKVFSSSGQVLTDEVYDVYKVN